MHRKIKRNIGNALLGLGVAALLWSTSQAIAAAINPQTTRIVQEVNTQWSKLWDVTQGRAQEVTILPGTNLPDGMQIESVGGKIQISADSEGLAPGLYTGVVEVEADLTPNVPNWLGAMWRRKATLNVEWHIAPADANDFFVGLGDILALPNP